MSRLLAALPAGYSLTALLVALLGGVLALIGMPRSEAVVTAAMCGFIIYLLILLWVFSAQNLTRLWLLILGGMVVTLTLLWLIL